MKSIVYYFSGTGNNYAIAKEITHQLGDSVMRPMSDLLSNKIVPEEYEWVGFVAPSYFSHVPPYVEQCMKDVVYSENHKVFLVVGCGGNRGLSIQDMRKHVNNSKKDVDLEYMIVLPGSYILSYGAFPLWYQTLTTQLANWKIKKITRDIEDDRKRKNLKKGLFYKDKYETALQESIAQFPKVGEQYVVNETCCSCGTCRKICPTQNISMTNGKVDFGDCCNQCMGCIQWCPQNAIDYKDKAKNRKKYHHLNVKTNDMFIR